MDYERLIRQADQTSFEGWDFGVFRGRFVEAEPSWEFSKLLQWPPIPGHRAKHVRREVGRQERKHRSGERSAPF
jgi:hypothetical protein